MLSSTSDKYLIQMGKTERIHKRLQMLEFGTKIQAASVKGTNKLCSGSGQFFRPMSHVHESEQASR